MLKKTIPMTLLALSVLFHMLTVSSLAAAEDIDVSDCRVFIEKAGVSYRDHSVHVVNLFLRTQDDFDSPIQSVIFYSHQHYEKDGVPTDLSAQMPASLYLESKNLWLISIAVTPHSEWVSETSESGVFAITTESGTRYWLRAAGSRNFLLDTALFNNLAKTINESGIQTGDDFSVVHYEASPDRAISTKKDFPYLNPFVCE
jgi:hypothetical protein